MVVYTLDILINNSLSGNNLCCIVAGHVNIVRHLLQHGANVEQDELITRDTPLLAAIKNGML